MVEPINEASSRFFIENSVAVSVGLDQQEPSQSKLSA
jgi:hypothetical protein